MASRESKKSTNSEKLLLARKFKEDGNACHKCQDFRHAIGKYHRALLQLKSIGSDRSAVLGAFMSSETMEEMGYSETVTEEDKLEMSKLSADCYNNLAACLLKQCQPNYIKIVEYCENVIEFEPQNVKALYRKGVAFYNLKKYEEALESFELSESIDSTFSASLITKHKRLCTECIRRQDQKLREAYRGMFTKKSADKEKSNG